MHGIGIRRQLGAMALEVVAELVRTLGRCFPDEVVRG